MTRTRYLIWVKNCMCSIADSIQNGCEICLLKSHAGKILCTCFPLEQGTETIISETGKFELGFFRPGNSNDHYIGIWYKNIPNKTIIWVANREAPVSNPSLSKLTISKMGSLVLLNNLNTPVWSTNTKSATAAVLLDTGNLVLVNGSGSGSYVWQSFNYPTDTWMPGGWLGFDKITGEYQSLTSWKNSDNPGSGLFAESMDPDGSNQYVILWNGSDIYWSSGLWTGQFFKNVPGTKEKTFFNFSFVDNKKRKYATYTILDDSIITRCVIDSTGLVRQWFWLDKTQEWQTVFTQPLHICDVYSLCGDFGVCDEKSENVCQCLEGFKPGNGEEWKLNDWSSGCVRVSRLQCGEKDGFLQMNNMRLPAKSVNLKVKSGKECEARCMNNCSCNAYSYSGSNGCLIWKGEVRNLGKVYTGAGDTVFVRVLASDIIGESKGRSSRTTAVILGAVFGSISVICIAAGLCLICLKKKQNRTLKRVEGSLIQFKYTQLQKMTKNFSEKLGSGGFGTVFKGMMPDSTAIAVKKLEGIRQGEKQFRNEVVTLGAVQHVNLVQLYGFCIKGTERLLVYEFLSKGSLDFHLFQNSSTLLDWNARYRIALGAARGLTYLHEKCRERIVHCDIKPDNILLDDSFCPKVSDFGMAKLIGRDFSRVLTTMRGTMGYLAPEWISGLPISPKIDVYSYGMMLFEIVSGKRNRVRSEDGSLIFYPSWAARIIVENDDVMSLLDERLNGEADLSQVERMCKIAIWCVQDDENNRPTMAQVVQALEGLVEVSMPSVPDALKNVASACKLA